jgi:opacity protein-like surface antigen
VIKILKTLISLGLVLSLTTSASAEGFWDGQSYFGLSGMLATARNIGVDSASGNPDPAFVNDAEVTTHVGYGVSVYYGWLFDSNWRAEFELSRRGVNLNRISGPAGTASLNGKLAVNGFFVNAARDFRGSSFATPYLGVGAGVAVHELDLESVNGAAGVPKRSSVTPAFQLLAGVQLEAGEDTDIVMGYRYVNYYGPDFTEFSYDFVDFHNFEIGLKFYPEDW